VLLLENTRLKALFHPKGNFDTAEELNLRVSNWKDTMPNPHARFIGVSVTLCAALCLQSIGDSRPNAAEQVNPGVPAIDGAAKANAAYEAKDWANAAMLYQQVTKDQPSNGRVWYRWAASLHALDKQDEAIVAYQKSMEAGVPLSIGEYGMALAYASKHDAEKAFQLLQKAAQDGFNEPDRLAGDQELSPLRTDERFSKIVEQTTHNLKPCAYNPLHRQFDFWVGEWDVVTAEDAHAAGSSKIELILGDCVIQENWTSAGNIGYQGKSFNIYNTDLNRWEQFWNDNAGGMIHFYGGLNDKVMDFWTEEIPQKDGTKLKRHLQFIPSGNDIVRQFSRGSTDGGKTWKVEYDFIYNRKK
jgi:tetratricopeptide (TPR) repeat protein